MPQAIYVNRDGEISFFDHTSSDFMNWHYAITGTSGSGKSFAVVDLTLQLFSAGIEKQYLMTIKDDYDRFAETLGKLIIIDLDRRDVCINPFTGEISKHRLQQWTTTVELMIAKGDYQISRVEQRLIEQVVQYAYDIVPPDDILRPTWIQQAYLKFPYSDEDSRIAGMTMAREIGSYCESGIYGHLFDGPPSFTEKDKLVVFNLQNVLNEKISDVIINAIFTMVDNVMYLGDRGEKKHLLVDEMVSMISAKGGAAVANQIKRAFRTYRSLNCMCGIASQNEEDLTTEVGQAIIGNITKRLILKPRREMIPTLMESLGLRSERHQQFIASLDTRPGFYSEFYLMSPHGEVVCRLIPDKLTYALATTTPDDVSEIKRLREENGGDWWQATVTFAERYPHGVRAARSAARVAATPR
jgi:type IV secretory pathway VirB4 component